MDGFAEEIGGFLDPDKFSFTCCHNKDLLVFVSQHNTT
jgi:hypothetical protein